MKMKKPVKLKINGHDYDLELAPQTTLLEALRDHLGLTGAKEACVMAGNAAPAPCLAMGNRCFPA